MQVRSELKKCGLEIGKYFLEKHFNSEITFVVFSTGKECMKNVACTFFGGTFLYDMGQK